jgi:hypothetical protein
VPNAYVAAVEFDEVVARVRALVGSRVVSTLLDADGNELVRWEGDLVEEEDADGIFLIGAKPFLLDRADLATAEAIDSRGIRLRGIDGTSVELRPI